MLNINKIDNLHTILNIQVVYITYKCYNVQKQEYTLRNFNY